jgi:tetratricopeptide (TPR) repeat protein
MGTSDRCRRAVFLLLAACVALKGCGSGGITPIQTAFNKGAYQYSVGNYEEAASEYREAIADDENDLKSWFNLGLTYEALAEQAEEAADYRARAREAYEAVLSRQPGHPRAEINLAAMDYEAGNHDDAKDRLRRVLVADEANVLARTALAAHLMREGNLAEAATELDKARSADGTSVEVNGLLGDLAVMRGDSDKAREAYQRVLKRSSEDLHALLSLGELEAKADRLPEARRWLQQALYISPRHWKAHLLLADVAERQGDLKTAVRHLWEARDLHAMDAPATRSVDYDGRLRRLYQRLIDGNP